MKNLSDILEIAALGLGIVYSFGTLIYLHLRSKNKKVQIERKRILQEFEDEITVNSHKSYETYSLIINQHIKNKKNSNQALEKKEVVVESDYSYDYSACTL